MENKCDCCEKELKLIFEYKEQQFRDKIIPAGKFCSAACISEYISNHLEE